MPSLPFEGGFCRPSGLGSPARPPVEPEALLRSPAEVSGEALEFHVWSSSVTPGSLRSQQVEKHRHCLFFPIKVMHHRLSPGADASPAACQTRCAEQSRLDRKRIEARHVLCRVGAFDIEMIGLSEHGTRIADRRIQVQRHL